MKMWMLELGVQSDITDHNLSSIGLHAIFERILNALSFDITMINLHSK